MQLSALSQLCLRLQCVGIYKGTEKTKQTNLLKQ